MRSLSRQGFRVLIRGIDRTIPAITADLLDDKAYVGRVEGLSAKMNPGRSSMASRACIAIGRAYLYLRPIMMAMCIDISACSTAHQLMPRLSIAIEGGASYKTDSREAEDKKVSFM